MSISLVTSPDNWARVNDTNRMVYKFSSTNYTQPNFQYQFVLRYYEIDATAVDIGTFNIHPSSDGTVEFNPSEVYKSYLSYNFDASINLLDECDQAAKKFQLFVYEYYGTPPERITAGNWYESTPTNVYNGCQQNIPYDYTTLNPLGNMKWVMSASTTGQFLTDATEFHLDDTDYLFLYGLSDATADNRPNKIKYTIVYSGYTGLSVNANARLANNVQSLPNSTPDYSLDDKTSIPNNYWGILTAVTYDTGVTFTYLNSLEWYFPCGPVQLKKKILSPTQFNYTDWRYYDIDVVNVSGVTLNKYPVRVYKSDICDRYGAWQLFWLNPHGGFDTYTFDRKNDLSYKVNRDTYKQKLPPTYSTYSAGEKVFNVDVQEELTLRSRALTQQEMQLITQLVQSPVVYAIVNYEKNGVTYPYGVPYIVTTDNFKYEQKVNTKEIYCEVTLRPSNQRIIQRD